MQPVWYGVWASSLSSQLCIEEKYKHSNVTTLERVVQSSTVHGSNKSQLIRGHDGKKLVTWYNSSAGFTRLYYFIPSLSSGERVPGVVSVKEYANSPEEEIRLFKARVPDGEPVEIIPSGLDAARQWYLYEQIQQFCGSRLAAELACPKPTPPISNFIYLLWTIYFGYKYPEMIEKQCINFASFKASRVSSYCKKPGHYKCRVLKLHVLSSWKNREKIKYYVHTF